MNRSVVRLLIASGVWFANPAANAAMTAANGAMTAANGAVTAANGAVKEPVCEWQVERRLGHDPDAFTQGLDVVDGVIYESTGLYGKSTVRKTRLDNEDLIRRINLDESYFAEGLVVVDDRIFVLTWQEETGFVYDRESLKIIDEFQYNGEGWGLTFDGHSLIMSNGSAQLTFLDPKTQKVTKQVVVKSDAGVVQHLNELEYVDGAIFANIWQSEAIVKIDPSDGRVLAWLDMRGLAGPMKLPGVLNGIAELPGENRLLLTGKNWPAMFEVEINCP